ncbi:hypothetical protein BKA64DRAFT_722614 [Cadophora sp. MPI-SDFR-AT-0126]|nr:hypothetical protein BKA64DRAFT_722614 [Leotiomycetes sp. MPI-SDFR-AT-0126]
MQAFLQTLLILLCFGPLATAWTVPTTNPPARVIWETTGDSWLECITQRSNGDLLITRYDTGEIWTVNTKTLQRSLVHRFPPSSNVNSSLGIVEYEDDVFAFNGGQTSPPDRNPIAGSWSAWSIDLRGWTPFCNETETVTPSPPITRLTAIPEAGTLNGLTVLQPATTTGPRANGKKASPLLLLADSKKGIIYQVSPTAANKSARVLYSNPELLTPPPNSLFPVGLNGLQAPPVHKPAFVYFTGGARGTFYKLALSHTTVAVGAEPELIVGGFANLDDFALEADGTAYLSTGISNEIVRVSPQGAQTVVYKGTLISLSTATLLVENRGSKVLYVNTGRPPGYPTAQPGAAVTLPMPQRLEKKLKHCCGTWWRFLVIYVIGTWQ